MLMNTDRRDLSETSSCERSSKVFCKTGKCEGFFVENEENRGSNCEGEERVAIDAPRAIAPPSIVTRVLVHYTLHEPISTT